MKKLILCLTIAAATLAQAEMMDRPQGIRIGQRMLLKPYVSFSAVYDSNVDARRHGESDVVWVVNPGLGFEYKADTWALIANVFYQYNAYTEKHSQNTYDYHGCGEDVTFKWSNSKNGEKGWSLMLVESYKKVDQTEDMIMASGRNYDRSRQEFQFAGALQRRFNENWHGDINAGYYWLDYDKSDKYSSALYGWSRWSVGGELGFAPSRWTDILVAAGYQGYDQDNAGYSSLGYYSGESNGWTVHGGLGSYATERISYRLMAGWSRFDYGDGVDSSDGFTYMLSGNWKIGDTWNTMLMGNSYYQPSERDYGTSIRVDSLSWGIAKSLVRGKMSATFDVAYRREGHEYAASAASAYDIDYLTGRIGLNYTLNRFLQLYARFEYQQCWNTEGDRPQYDYDRFRGTLGFRLTY